MTAPKSNHEIGMKLNFFLDLLDNKSFFFQLICSLVALLGIAIDAKDVFRYVDEETGQSHYMTGKSKNHHDLE